MFAYLDPAAGSGLVAILGAGTAGLAVAWRMLKHKVRPGDGAASAATTTEPTAPEQTA